MKVKRTVHYTEDKIDELKFKVKDKLGLFDPVIIYPYRGFGNEKIAYMHGRVLEKESIIHEPNEEQEFSFWNNIKKVWKRYESDEVPGVKIFGELAGNKASTVTTDEGYFTLKFEFDGLANGWHKVDIKIEDMPFDLDYEAGATGEIMICDQTNAFGIISDVDDTIIKSNAINPLKKLATMLKKDAASRVAFKGVGKLYEALIDKYNNPLFFISGSSFNLYDLLTAFCDHNKIPKAPFLLRDLGLETKQWVKQDTRPYKIEQIEKILDVYGKMSFVCIGDSGQQDPEIYSHIHKKYPGRIKAIYIRHVYSDERKNGLEEMAKDYPIPFLIMEDSNDALEHAKSMGWIY